MKKLTKTFLIVALLFFGVIGGFWYFVVRDKSPDFFPERQRGKAGSLSPRMRKHGSHHYEEIFHPTNSIPEADVLLEFAAAANLYNFNRQIVCYRTNKTFSAKILEDVEIETPTHYAYFKHGKLRHVESFLDSADFAGKPEVVKKWHQCTGKWSEEAAFAEIMKVLRETGQTRILTDIVDGQKIYTADEITVRRPDGQRITITPFPVVKMFDKDGALRVWAEYRMGTSGPAGLTMWFCLP